MLKQGTNLQTELIYFVGQSDFCAVMSINFWNRIKFIRQTSDKVCQGISFMRRNILSKSSGC